MLEHIRVFISYSRKDGTEETKRLYKELYKQGVNVWYDNAGIDLLADFTSEIDRAIDLATHMVVIVTPDVYRANSFVRLEMTAAIAQRKPIIPLVFPGGRCPITIVNYIYIDFSDWDEGFTALIKRLERSGGQEIIPKNLREQELAYLQQIGQRYDHWQVLYTDIVAKTQVLQRKVKVKSPTAARYLVMQHAIFKDISYEFDTDRTKTIIVESFESLYDEIFKHERVALIGEPGAGKTTTLERMAYELAIKAVEDEFAPLPLFVRLGAYTGGDFKQFLDASFPELALRDYPLSKIFFLLDGLNEMPSEHLSKLQNWLDHQEDIFVVVTCRKLDYIGLKLPLQRIDVQPLDVNRIYLFISNYLEEDDCEHLFWALSEDETYASWRWLQKEDPEATFEKFWFGTIDYAYSWDNQKYHLKQVQDALRLDGRLPGMLGVVSNPFLLFVVVQIYVREGQYPKNRAQLFDLFITSLMEQRGKPASIIRPLWIDETIQRRALVALAYRMQNEHKGTSVDEEWVLNIISASLSREDANQLIYLAASAGIIERRDKKIRFVHQLLQEYFAAYEMDEDLRRGVPAGKYWPSASWWEPTGWEETTILLAGIQKNADATNVIRWLTPIQPILAFRCVKESGSILSRDALYALYNPPDGSRISPAARAEWGRILAEQGDTRPGVGLRADGLPDIFWCEVPAGKFWMGGDQRVAVSYSRWDGAEIEINYNYWLARYPVTYAQYEAFVNGDGYTNDVYWTETGREWRGNRREPRYWNDSHWHISNHPVVGVTWYEAYAFTQWLNALTDPDLKPASDAIIRLPTEAEWERAARYPNNRKYAWGDEYAAVYANVDETSAIKPIGPNCLRRTSAVGIYSQGASALGIYDLNGNVWEWGMSQWSALYQHPENNDPRGSALRMLRGGSWFYDENFARSASRSRDSPGNKDYDVGFRLCAFVPSYDLPIGCVCHHGKET